MDYNGRTSGTAFFDVIPGEERITKDPYGCIPCYPQVCLAALAWLKTEVLQSAGKGEEESLALPFQAGTTNNQFSKTRHGPDFRSVDWCGREYPFTKAQAACVKVLWEAWENGTPEVGNYTILQAAKSEQSRLQDVFKQRGKMHPAWGTMIVSCPTNKGAFRLQESPFPIRMSPRKSPR
jgi:hypothetical protein